MDNLQNAEESRAQFREFQNQRLAKHINKAIVEGLGWLTVKAIYDHQKEKLEELGYYVSRDGPNWIISWE